MATEPKHHISATDDWEKAILSESASLSDVIQNLDDTGFQIAMVVSADRELLGTVTDGDVRRGLLRGLALGSSVATIMFRNPLVVPPQLQRDSVLQIMGANKIHQMPVVDEMRKVVGLHLWAELFTPPQRSNLMLIMAGGQGKRLRPYTENCPKPLLPVGGKPIIQHIIERARRAGFDRFIIAINYLGHMIVDHLGDGSRLGVSIEYLTEEKPLGTAGAIGLLENKPTDAFVVSNGDVLTDINYGDLLDFHRCQGAVATMAVSLHEWQNPFGVVRIEGLRIVGFEEKPVIKSHINAGIYVLNPEAVAEIQGGEHCDMPSLFERLCEHGFKAIAYPMHEPWLDVGRPNDLIKAREDAGASGQTVGTGLSD